MDKRKEEPIDIIVYKYNCFKEIRNDIECLKKAIDLNSDDSFKREFCIALRYLVGNKICTNYEVDKLIEKYLLNNLREIFRAILESLEHKKTKAIDELGKDMLDILEKNNKPKETKL